jgi:hypothetical protein
MGLFDLVKMVLGEKSTNDSQPAKDEQLACLYEACSQGTLPIINNPPVILKRGETAHLASPKVQTDMPAHCRHISLPGFKS